MASLATYEDGHLLVAGVRVLCDRLKHPPSFEELADFLGRSREWTAVLAGALEREGILLLVDSAFVTRVEVKDHLKLESLTRAAEDTGLDDELRSFTEKRRAEDEKLEGLFSGGESVRRHRDKMDDLEDQLKRFRPKAPKSSPLFRDPPPEDD